MLLLDEPLGQLDSLTRMELQDVILRILDKEKITTMIITHDPDEAVYMSDRICMMTNGLMPRLERSWRLILIAHVRATKLSRQICFMSIAAAYWPFLTIVKRKSSSTEKRPARSIFEARGDQSTSK